MNYHDTTESNIVKDEYQVKVELSYSQQNESNKTEHEPNDITHIQQNSNTPNTNMQNEMLDTNDCLEFNNIHGSGVGSDNIEDEDNSTKILEKVQDSHIKPKQTSHLNLKQPIDRLINLPNT